MKVLSFVHQKGGVSKSTLAFNLAAYLSDKGKTAVIDLDPQGSLVKWYGRRENSSPEVYEGKIAELEAALRTFEREGYQYVLIDTPGRDSSAMTAAIAVSSLSVIPCQDSVADIEVVQPTVDACRRAGKPFAWVISRIRAQRGSRKNDAFRTMSMQGGAVCPTALVERYDHKDAQALGQGVHEFSPKSLATDEIRLIADWLLKMLEK